MMQMVWLERKIEVQEKTGGRTEKERAGAETT
jgi:hypothetical protein